MLCSVKSEAWGDLQLERRLSAILAADAVGYSKLMASDETGTMVALREHREELFDPEIASSEHPKSKNEFRMLAK
jgi:class 3 adenylate cyclase